MKRGIERVRRMGNDAVLGCLLVMCRVGIMRLAMATRAEASRRASPKKREVLPLVVLRPHRPSWVSSAGWPANPVDFFGLVLLWCAR